MKFLTETHARSPPGEAAGASLKRNIPGRYAAGTPCISPGEAAGASLKRRKGASKCELYGVAVDEIERIIRRPS
jgi:hypothetical protein